MRMSLAAPASLIAAFFVYQVRNAMDQGFTMHQTKDILRALPVQQRKFLFDFLNIRRITNN